MHKLFARRAHEFTTIREFTTTAECIAALREEGRTIWATDLSQHAVCLTEPALRAAAAAATTAAAAANVEPNAPPGPSSSLTSTSLTPAAEWATSVVPNKLAIVFGTESVGCTEEILTAADLRVYLPLRGFADSLNLSVAAALVMHELFHLCPEAIGEMSDAERATLREKWFTQLAVGRVQTRAEGKRAKDVQAKLTRVRKKRKEMSSLGGATGLGAGAVSVRAAARAVARADVGPTGGAVVAVGGVHDVSDLKAVEAALVAEAAAIEAGRWAAARAVVAPHLANPPAVLRDMRRPDAHREAFVGPSVRARNAEHWAGMAAVAHSSGLAVGEAQPKSRREGGVGDDPATATGGGGE
uniref:tRNA/rRNA methyltransferase SpoU type domain-containing protein n=1 Tax=Mantoniella antarctica TaxID=81844 RepID=A0A7S0SP19_9CHLO